MRVVGVFSLSSFYCVSILVREAFLARTRPFDPHTSETFSCGSLLDVFCLPQLILQGEEKKNRLSTILPHSPLLSPLGVTGALFFTVCEMTHSLLTKAQQKTTPQFPGLLQPSPLLWLSHFTQITEKVVSSPDSSATVRFLQKLLPLSAKRLVPSANLLISSLCPRQTH